MPTSVVLTKNQNHKPNHRIIKLFQRRANGNVEKSLQDEGLCLLANAGSAEDMVRIRNLPFETHYTTTSDGYILSLHRIPRPGAPVVLLWHGFMMCSEVWVCHPDPNNSLACVLYAAGYDVWMGNSRGNKYSCKHKTMSQRSLEFWNFSIDQFATIDLPETVDYILAQTSKPDLTYVGFSQGTTVGFSALSANQNLNKKINLFVALAAVMRPAGLENQLANALIRASPEVIYLLFGRRRMLPSAVFWIDMLPRSILNLILDIAMNLLFGWKCDLMDSRDKHAFYGHLYSFTSVKNTVHWFQILRTGKFQMYNESPSMFPTKTTGTRRVSSGFFVPLFPTKQITTPVAIMCGGRDSLPDMEYIKRNISSCTFYLNVEEYEHLDFLWAKQVHSTVHPAVLSLLDSHNPVTEHVSPIPSLPPHLKKYAKTISRPIDLPPHHLRSLLRRMGQIRFEVLEDGETCLCAPGSISIYKLKEFLIKEMMLEDERTMDEDGFDRDSETLVEHSNESEDGHGHGNSTGFGNGNGYHKATKSTPKRPVQNIFTHTDSPKRRQGNYDAYDEEFYDANSDLVVRERVSPRRTKTSKRPTNTNTNTNTKVGKEFSRKVEYEYMELPSGAF